MFESLTLPLLLRAAPILIPVAAKLAKHVFDTDSKLLNDLIELAVEKGEGKAKDQLETALKQKPDVVLAWHRHVFIDYTGWVLGQLVQHLSQQPQFSAEKKALEQLAEQAPEGWKTFVLKGSPGLSPVHQDVFLHQMAVALSRGEELPPIDTVPFISFFNWHVRLSPPLQERLATHLRTHLDNAIQWFLVSDYPQANQAYKQIILNGIDGLHASLKTLHQKIDVTVPVIVDTNNRVQQLQMEQSQLLGPLVEMMKGKTKEERLDQYKRALLAAFRPYQELAIDHFAAADQAAPEIWDIFVHPACSEEYLRPEEMDAAQRERPPRNPAVELLPLLAREDHRRTVLLGDPGMGKSTVIQALIAHLASGRALVGAPALTGLLPVPLILRDLVPLLPQDQVEGWNWEALLDTFLCHYQRDEAAPKLCDAFQDHLPEFHQHLHTAPKAFFLIDGLDEIGDLAKRRKIVECIQDGIKNTSKEARWVITSRVIGYEDAPVDMMSGRCYASPEALKREKALNSYSRVLTNQQVKDLVGEWMEFVMPGDRLEVRDSDKKTYSLPDPIRTAQAHSVFIPREMQSSVFHGADDGMEREFSSPEDELPFYHAIPVFTNDDPGTFVAGYHFKLHIAKRLYLAPFDDRRQDAFTQRWFQHRHSTDYSKELMWEVRAHHHNGVRIISRVPNLLCLMTILKRSGKPLPDGRAALYDEIVKAYLGGIDAAYRLRPVLGNTCPFPASQRRFLLTLLGAHMQQQRVARAAAQVEKGQKPKPDQQQNGEGTILISKPEIATLLVPAIERMVAEGRGQSDHTALELLDELLHHIASRSGLLIPHSNDENGDTLFAFTHLSFLEFFAAEWLGIEFDRQRNRIVRQSLATEEGPRLSDDELDLEFPPQGPVQHTSESFKELARLPAWHEPLIFLMETRKADSPTLLRWLLPSLHTRKQEATTKVAHTRHPILPLDTVRLVIKLARDPEIPLPSEKRQAWWRILWCAYRDWPHPPWLGIGHGAWPIAPILLESQENRPEVLNALVEIQSKRPEDTLYLSDCRHLKSLDLKYLGRLESLTRLDLSGCIGLNNLGELRLPKLQALYLKGCTGLHEAACLSSVADCPELTQLYLNGCTGLIALEGIQKLRMLRELVLNGCSSLQGLGCLEPLAECPLLVRLDISGCTRLSRKDVEYLQEHRSTDKPPLSIVGP